MIYYSIYMLICQLICCFLEKFCTSVRAKKQTHVSAGLLIFIISEKFGQVDEDHQQAKEADGYIQEDGGFLTLFFHGLCPLPFVIG